MDIIAFIFLTIVAGAVVFLIVEKIREYRVRRQQPAQSVPISQLQTAPASQPAVSPPTQSILSEEEKEKKEEKKEEKEDIDPIKRYPWLYRAALIALAGIWFVVGLFFFGSTFNLVGAELNLGILVWILGALHFVAGFDIIKRNERAGVFVLGIPTIEVSGMFVFVPPGIFQKEEVTALVIELPWPEDPTKVWRGDPNEEVPKGYFLPIRIPFADADPGEGEDDPFNRRATHEVSLFVRIRVRDFFDFYTRIGDTDKNIGNVDEYGDNPAKMLTNARHQIGNMATGLINQVFTKMSPAKALKALTDEKGGAAKGVDQKLLEHIKAGTRGWGIDVVTARVKLIEPSKNFNFGIQTAALGAAEARKAADVAKGEKVKRTLEGEGTANAVKAELFERTKGLKKMAKDLGVPIETVLAAETARAIAQGQNEKLILPGIDSLTQVIDSVAKGFRGKPASTGGA